MRRKYENVAHAHNKMLESIEKLLFHVRVSFGRWEQGDWTATTTTTATNGDIGLNGKIESINKIGSHRRRHWIDTQTWSRKFTFKIFAPFSAHRLNAFVRLFGCSVWNWNALIVVAKLWFAQVDWRVVSKVSRRARVESTICRHSAQST